MKSKTTVPAPELSIEVRWRETGDAEFPFEASVDSAAWRIRVNGFPDDEHVYTLMIDGHEAVDFDEWPRRWNR